MKANTLRIRREQMAALAKPWADSAVAQMVARVQALAHEASACHDAVTLAREVAACVAQARLLGLTTPAALERYVLLCCLAGWNADAVHAALDDPLVTSPLMRLDLAWAAAAHRRAVAAFNQHLRDEFPA